MADVVTIDNIAPESRGCMAPVNLLRDAGVVAIVVSVPGNRPM